VSLAQYFSDEIEEAFAFTVCLRFRLVKFKESAWEEYTSTDTFAEDASLSIDLGRVSGA
jgi:hypothetical protein